MVITKSRCFLTTNLKTSVLAKNLCLSETLTPVSRLVVTNKGDEISCIRVITIQNSHQNVCMCANSRLFVTTYVY